MIGKKMQKLIHTCFEGEITVSKAMCWLVGGVCLLAGIVYGMKAAPLTHGITIGSNNGNQTNCNWDKKEQKEEEAETAAENKQEH